MVIVTPVSSENTTTARIIGTDTMPVIAWNQIGMKQTIMK
jgi:hypothetical protein